MSRRHAGYAIDPSTGKPVLGGGGVRRQPSPILLPGQQPADLGQRIAPQAPRLDQLIPYLWQQLGHVPQLQIMASPINPGNVAFVARCGPIAIPLEFDPATMDSTIIPAIQRAYEEASALAVAAGAQATEPGPGPAEDLLAEAQANVAQVPDDAPDHARPIVLGPGTAVVELHLPDDAQEALAGA